jgi:hypothetical protein
VPAFAQAGVGTHEGNNGRSSGKTGDSAAASEIRRSNLGFIPEEAKLQAVMWAGAYAVHAHEALSLAPGHAADRIVAALTTEQAAVAFVAGGGILVQTKNGPAGHCAKQRAEGTEAAAPKTSNAEADQKNGDEEDAQDEALRKVGLAQVEDRGLKRRVESFASGLDGRDFAVLKRRKDSLDSEVECRQKRKSKGADKQAEGIEPANRRRAKAGSDETGNENDIFDGLPSFVTIGIDALLAPLGLGRQAADEVLKRAQGADPTAEKAPEKERRDQDYEAQKQAPVQCVTGEGVGESDERIEFEKQADWSAKMYVSSCARRGAQRSEDQQRKEQEQKENLRGPAQKRQLGMHQETPQHIARRRKPSMINDSLSRQRRAVTSITDSARLLGAGRDRPAGKDW